MFPTTEPPTEAIVYARFDHLDPVADVQLLAGASGRRQSGAGSANIDCGWWWTSSPTTSIVAFEFISNYHRKEYPC